MFADASVNAGAGDFNDIYTLDTASGVWTAPGVISGGGPSTREGMGFVAHDELIYLFGGGSYDDSGGRQGNSEAEYVKSRLNFA